MKKNSAIPHLLENFNLRMKAVTWCKKNGVQYLGLDRGDILYAVGEAIYRTKGEWE